MTGLLDRVRIVETGVLMAVDCLGRLLGDEGADVVKVEAPGRGDYLRNIMVRFAPDHSAYHLILNRNKRSLTCDARRPEGQEVLARLIEPPTSSSRATSARATGSWVWTTKRCGP